MAAPKVVQEASKVVQEAPRIAHHIAKGISVKGLRHDMATVDGFNAKVALFLTKVIGNMWAFWFLTIMMAAWMIGLGATVAGDTYPWNLMLLAVGGIFQALAMIAIMVGQNIQGVAADARSAKAFADTEAILDAMDTKTKGGLKEVLDAINAK